MENLLCYNLVTTWKTSREVMIMKTCGFINESLRYIEEHLEENLTVAEFAEQAGYSESAFSRIFRREMGCSVLEHVRRRKLLKASELILNGTKVIDAAFQYGWQTHSGFTKAFRQEFGFSPSLLRAMRMQADCLKGGNGMSHILYNIPEEHEPKEQLFQLLKIEMTENDNAMDVEELKRVYDFACQIYCGMKRYSGDEYVTHPLNTALILAQMNAEKNTVYAGMFCDALEKTKVTAQEMKGHLPLEAVMLVQTLKNYELENQVFSENEEAALVKIAERLHNMRTVRYMDEAEAKKKVKETLEFFLPAARKLGNNIFIEELNDLVLRFGV